MYGLIFNQDCMKSTEKFVISKNEVHGYYHNIELAAKNDGGFNIIWPSKFSWFIEEQGIFISKFDSNGMATEIVDFDPTKIP